MALIPRPKLPKMPRQSVPVRPVMSEAEKAIRRQKNAKRKKKCVKATSFPCGFTCLPKMTKKGEETNCKNILRGQAKTYVEWMALVQERASKVNNARLEKGKSGIYINTQGKRQGNVEIVGREKLPKAKGGRKRKTEEVQPEILQREPVQIIEKNFVTDRRDLLPKVNESVIPKQLVQHLSVEGKEGVARAITAMNKNGGFLLADGTGIGKSRQQLAVAQYYAEQGKKVLIISPNAVIKPDYDRETVSGSFNDDGKTMGVNFNLNKGDKKINQGEIHLATYQNLDKLKTQVDGNTVLIFDEAHMMKNATSARTKHGMEMLDKAASVLYATATPADKPEHLYYLHRADTSGSSAFARHMGIRKSTTVNEDGSTTVTWGKEREKKPKAHGRQGRMVERAKKKDETKISKATRDAIAVSNLFDELTKSGMMVRREISMDGVKVNMTNIQVDPKARMTMEKIEERYATGQQSSMATARQLMDQRRQLEPYKVPEATRLTMEAIKKGHQVLIFADRVNASAIYDDVNKERKEAGLKAKAVAESEGTIPLLRKQLESMGIDPNDIVEMHGQAEIPQAEALNRFQSGKAKIMIGTSKVMGTGINADDTVGDSPRTTIMMTPEFSASDFMQIVGRTWRKNTNSIPDLHVLFSDLEVDQWGKELLASKLITLGASVGGAPKSLQFKERRDRGFGFHFIYH